MTTALLIIDLQRGMFAGSQRPHAGDQVLSRVAALLARARAQDTPVLHVQHDGGPGDDLERQTAGWEIHPAVAPQGAEPVIEKIHCSAFQETDLHQQLQNQGVTRLVIAGMQTEYCIDTACRTAYGLGYEVVLVEDAHTTFDTPTLAAAQIVAHHNHTLKGSFVTLATAAAVAL
jgi:nicotinamidase-related amidase